MSKRRGARPRWFYLVLIAVLLLLLVGLLWVYRVMISPPTLATGGTDGEEGYTHRFSLYGFGGERLSKPSDVAIGDDGSIYVVDTFNHRVVVFDERGRYLEHFGERGSEQYQIEYPSGIAVAPDATVFVLSKGQDKVVVFDPARKPIGEVKVESPQVATVSGGRFYLVTNRGVMIGDLQGTQISAFGRRGSEPGQVDHPGGIAIGDDGTVYLADSLNYRVQALDSDGKPLWVAGEPLESGEALQSKGRRFGLPVGLARGADGLLYLVDAFNGTIHVMDSETGEELARHGEWGHEEGSFYYPAGIAHGQGGMFAVADKFNDRVQVLSIHSPTEPAVLTALRRLPWWPLLALPLLLAALLLRKRHTADREFLVTVIDGRAIASLDRSVRHLDVTPQMKADFSEVELDETDLDALLRATRVSARRVSRLQERHGLDAESAFLLARAKRPLRLPSVLLADGKPLIEAARSEGVEVLDSDAVLEYWGHEQTSNEGVGVVWSTEGA